MKMKIQNKKTSSIKKLLIPSLIIAVLLVGGGYVYALSNNILPPALGGEEKEAVIDSPNDPVPTGPVPTDNTDKENLGKDPEVITGSRTVTITAASVNGDLLQIRALIQGVVSSGKCQVSVKKDGQEIISETADVQPGPSSTTCRGFDLDVSDVENGALTASVNYIDGNQVSTSGEQTVALIR